MSPALLSSPSAVPNRRADCRPAAINSIAPAARLGLAVLKASPPINDRSLQQFSTKRASEHTTVKESARPAGDEPTTQSRHGLTSCVGFRAALCRIALAAHEMKRGKVVIKAQHDWRGESRGPTSSQEQNHVYEILNRRLRGSGFDHRDGQRCLRWREARRHIEKPSHLWFQPLRRRHSELLRRTIHYRGSAR